MSRNWLELSSALSAWGDVRRVGVVMFAIGGTCVVADTKEEGRALFSGVCYQQKPL